MTLKFIVYYTCSKEINLLGDLSNSSTEMTDEMGSIVLFFLFIGSKLKTFKELYNFKCKYWSKFGI